MSRVQVALRVADKVWVNDPGGAPWEVYTVLADAPADDVVTPGPAGGPACCDAPVISTTDPAADRRRTAAACC